MSNEPLQIGRFAGRRMAVGVGATVLVLLSGCGRPLGTLEGVVTFEGEPVAAGHVMLFPTDGNYRNASSVRIADGRYRITGIVPGERRISLEHLELPGTAGGEPRRVPDISGSFPEKLTVVAGRHRLDFELRRSAKKPREGRSQ